MSKIHTVRGVCTVPNVEKILLFGDRQENFDRGYKIVDFQVATTNPTGGEEVTAFISTIEEAHSALWNWAKNTQVAWATWNAPTSTRSGQYSNVDREVILVEDVYVDGAGTTGQTFNWELTLEEVKISDSQAALSMVNTRAQGSD